MNDSIEPSKSAPQHLFNLLKQFDVAMLLTGTGDREARPMTIAEIDYAGTVWFVTSLNAERTRELQETPRVTMICQSKTVFVSVTGVARVSRDEAKISALWKEPFKVWFSQGRSSPDIALIAVTPVAGEFWDQSGTKGLKYLFETAKAYVSGEAVKGDGDNHAVARLDEPPLVENRKSAH